MLLLSLLPVATTSNRPHIVVVGGGWAGFGAVHAIARAGLDVDVTLLEASTAAGGLAAGWRSAKGQAVEAGIHGFWRNYRNIDRLVGAQLGLQPFTPFTPSALHTKQGLAVTAPVLGDLPRLPAPLGTALWPRFGTIRPADQLTAASVLGAFLDFDGGDAAWRRWDKMTARELFGAVSNELYAEFLEPMLLVLPMCPGEDCSAAAALSLFSFFALEHQADFDVRWLRASASDAIFKPWAADLEQRPGVRIAYGKRLVDVVTAPRASQADGDERVVATHVRCDDGEVLRCDAIVSAVGIGAARRIFAVASGLQGVSDHPEVRSLASLRGVDVVAVRLWLNRRLSPPCVSNVCGAGMAAGLEQTGFTFYDLTALQGLESDGGGSVVEVDFYYAKRLLAQTDDEIVRTAAAALRRALPAAYGSLDVQRDVVDSAVVRVQSAVSHFAPGAYEHLPPIESRAMSNWFWAGDWVDRGGHRSWSQEKAFVTGLQAAKGAVARVLGRPAATRVQEPLEVEPDEPHIAVGRAVAKALRTITG